MERFGRSGRMIRILLDFFGIKMENAQTNRQAGMQIDEQWQVGRQRSIPTDDSESNNAKRFWFLF